MSGYLSLRLIRGLTLGCRYPRYEGYTSDDKPACGGKWWIEAANQEKDNEESKP